MSPSLLNVTGRGVCSQEELGEGGKVKYYIFRNFSGTWSSNLKDFLSLRLIEARSKDKCEQ